MGTNHLASLRVLIRDELELVLEGIVGVGRAGGGGRIHIQCHDISHASSGVYLKVDVECGMWDVGFRQVADSLSIDLAMIRSEQTRWSI